MARLIAGQIGQSSAADTQVLRWDDVANQWIPALKMNEAGLAAPTATDDVTEGYDIGSMWIDVTSTDNIIAYICVDNAAANARWKRQSDAVPIIDNKNMEANDTSFSDPALATDTPLLATPSGGGFIQVAVDGKIVSVGGASKDKDCYFSGDSGTTARNLGAAIEGDELYWASSIAGYDLDDTMAIDFFYSGELATLM